MRVPAGLDWWRDVSGGAEWLASLPSIVEACAELWTLRVGAPFTGGNVSLVVQVECEDGTPAVLKVNFPDEESEREPDALRLWDGRGAVRLLAYDEGRRALLVERCEPGSQLWAVEDDGEAMHIAARVLAMLWRQPPDDHGFVSLADGAARWSVELLGDWEGLGRPFERGLLDEALTACLELGRDQGELVVLHQDFHGGNVLTAQREPWLAIDPKPLVGEREFDAASLLRDRRWLLGQPDDGARIRRRLDLLSAELNLDRERMRRWGIAHALAWGVSETKVEDDMIECARLLLAARS
ncbi:MAG: aminoglycoside/hydroxyurea antibiotic resistance kinase [Thermoleophilia bacterium]|nr:aminoglycoside/hydroxyurea antibiotic resistance kinase [Thermoleophilia bacterium]